MAGPLPVRTFGGAKAQLRRTAAKRGAAGKPSTLHSRLGGATGDVDRIIGRQTPRSQGPEARQRPAQRQSTTPVHVASTVARAAVIAFRS
jgi:hypothetical protein